MRSAADSHGLFSGGGHFAQLPRMRPTNTKDRSMLPRFIHAGRRLSRFVGDERGNFAVTAALLMIPLMSAIGGAVDLAYAVDVQNTLQQASDSAALAAAREETDPAALAEAAFESNLPERLANATMQLTINDDGSVTVDASAIYKPAFMSLVGVSSLNIAVSSRAISSMTPDQTVTTTKTETVTTHATACMLARASNGGNALLVNSPARVDSKNCEIHVRSGSNDAFMFNTGATFNASKFCIKGTATARGTTNAAIETDCDAAPDTIAGSLPTPNDSFCTFNNFTPANSEYVVLTPGTYCGWSNFNGKPKITLTPGLYIIKNGGWNFNDGIEVTGAGVSIYLTGNGATINMNGKISWDISAPTSGTYEGILYFQNPSLPAGNFIFNGLNGQHLQGLIYLPTQNIQFKSKSKSGTRDAISVVANTIIIDGEAVWNFGPAAGKTVPGSETTTTKTVTTTETIPGERGATRLMD